jgi:hypothetical protein
VPGEPAKWTRRICLGYREPVRAQCPSEASVPLSEGRAEAGREVSPRMRSGVHGFRREQAGCDSGLACVLDSSHDTL